MNGTICLNVFFEMVSAVQPLFFVAENVPGIMRDKYDSIRNRAFSIVRNNYNLLEPILVNASEYGAATSRTRYFFIGIRKGSGIELCDEDFYKAKVANEFKTNVSEALEGLPIGLSHSIHQSGIHSVGEHYSDKAGKHLQNAFFYSRTTNDIPSGVGNPVFVARYQKEHITNGFLTTNHTESVANRYRNLKFGEQDKVSKSYKLNPDAFCPTLRAGTGPDKGSFQAVRPIHYNEPRVINPREAARLQGFPDWFELPNTIWHSFRQIGNSVSPIAAEAIMRVIYDHLPKRYKR